MCPPPHRRRHPVMTYEGLAWCHIPADSHPLHLSHVLSAAGRWNEHGRFGCLYLCTDQAGAMAEYHKALAAGEIDGEHHLVSLQINRLTPVADLTQPFTDFPAVDYRMLTSDDPSALRHCRDIAKVARTAGYTGMLVPSSALKGAVNLVVYFDVVDPVQVNIEDGPYRMPLRADQPA